MRIIKKIQKKRRKNEIEWKKENEILTHISHTYTGYRHRADSVDFIVGKNTYQIHFLVAEKKNIYIYSQRYNMEPNSRAG